MTEEFKPVVSKKFLNDLHETKETLEKNGLHICNSLQREKNLYDAFFMDHKTDDYSAYTHNTLKTIIAHVEAVDTIRYITKGEDYTQEHFIATLKDIVSLAENSYVSSVGKLGYEEESKDTSLESLVANHKDEIDRLINAPQPTVERPNLSNNNKRQR